MSVNIEPAEQLEFHGPFTRVSKESLHVKNPGTEPIIFKVKTTAPKQYCVRPNAGRIEPNSEIEVQIILQPFKEDLPQDYKCKDKFLVQTAPIHQSFEQQDVTSMWGHVESLEKETMRQHKIKCVFVVPNKEEENIVSPIPEPVTTTDIASSPLNTSSIDTTPVPVPAPAAPAVPAVSVPSPVTATAPPTAPVPAPVAAPVTVAAPIAAPVQETPVTATATAPTIVTPETKHVPTIRSVAPTVSQTTVSKDPVLVPTPNNKTVSEPTKNTNAEVELRAALEKIAILEQQLAEAQKESVRARTNGRKLAATVQPLDAVHQHLAALEKPSPVEGYPPQVVMAVAALVFIFTYIFF